MFAGLSAWAGPHLIKFSNDLGSTFDLVQLNKCKYFPKLAFPKSFIVELFLQKPFSTSLIKLPTSVGFYYY